MSVMTYPQHSFQVCQVAYNLPKMSSNMTSSKSHYHRNRLLRDRIRKEEANPTAPSAGAVGADVDDNFALPDYFSPLPDLPPEDLGRYPKVVLWDEVA